MNDGTGAVIVTAWRDSDFWSTTNTFHHNTWNADRSCSQPVRRAYSGRIVGFPAATRFCNSATISDYLSKSIAGPRPIWQNHSNKKIEWWIICQFKWFTNEWNNVEFDYRYRPTFHTRSDDLFRGLRMCPTSEEIHWHHPPPPVISPKPVQHSRNHKNDIIYHQLSYNGNIFVWFILSNGGELVESVQFNW